MAADKIPCRDRRTAAGRPRRHALASARPEIGIFWQRAGGSQSEELRRRRRTVHFSRWLARKGGMGGGETLGRRSSDRDVIGESTPEVARGHAEGFARPLFAGFGQPGTSALAGRSAVGRAYAGCVRGWPCTSSVSYPLREHACQLGSGCWVRERERGVVQAALA